MTPDTRLLRSAATIVTGASFVVLGALDPLSGTHLYARALMALGGLALVASSGVELVDGAPDRTAHERLIWVVVLGSVLVFVGVLVLFVR